MKNLVFLPVLMLLVTNVSCNKAVDYRPDGIGPVQQVVDLSGDWEKDYQHSDQFETEIKNYILKIQSQIRGLQEHNKRNPAFNNVDTAISMSRESILGLARFKEEITRMPVLHIVQDKTSVQIDREDDFALSCEIFDRQYSSKKNPYGTENCAWNRGQLFIQIILENGLNIVHQVTLAPDAQELNITTTVVSREANVPLTISNYYDRYTAPKDDYNCIQTLTRNDVCKKVK